MADKNLLARAGWNDSTDQDYIDEFGLNPDGDINQQMFDKVEAMNHRAYLEEGMREDKARSMAKRRKNMAMNAAKQAFKEE